MNINQLDNFVNIINNYDNMEYLFSTIARSAGPTIAKEKASSLITFSNNNRNLQSIWEQFKSIVEEKLDVNYFELKKDKTSTIVLFYNEKKLDSILKEEKNIQFLKRFGYENDMKLEDALILLSKRFENLCPHEIGIFLGYPVDDVAFFIDCPNEKCKMVGYWKVYHDIEEAKNIFKKYDDIKNNIISLIIKGIKPTEILKYKLVS
ncbi:DUF3793 family protein [Clostridium magnum]|nr:DUF3793 family protein [Clostridium magnum]SHI05247.1 Protein of unknown function [Clostridium magnum DSM 2767]